MKIIYHHRTRGDGAEGVHINEMIGAFRELEHEVEICCPRVANRPAGLKLGMTGISSKDSQGLLGWCRIAVRQIFEIAYNLISTPRLLTATLRIRPQLLYERYSCYHIAGPLVSRVLGVPIVLEVNSTYAGRFNRRRLAFPFICKAIEKWAFRNSTLIAVVSSPLRQCVLDRTEEKVPVLITPNAINERVIRSLESDPVANRATLGIGDSDIVIGFVGSLRRWHGVDMLTRKIPYILSQVPHSVFLIVGSGELESSLNAVKLRQGIGSRLVLTGGVDHDKVNALIDAMDIGLMPHSNDWGSPMKILEYMALGKLCIAPRLPPIEEILCDNETGLLFEAGDDDAFAGAIVYACENAERRKRIGKTAREFVLAQRKWTDNARMILTRLSEIKK
ncbi:2-deoxystreptamine glucosyltransferase [Rubripirellula lacrimiformis]|uniref:2-deoxystreptamine glucosyltransferase n=1 Tax=Rubripirellula lacrimiformis TaxID=1930273 RepID=A0A517NGM4_9BACT|nr:glycosyltransferase [Rubripirellula lacrimiformis]QDT06280.1 2-deoxystreptamine glucosyltransferase [Rubripirellula lacrimiformis]